MEVEVAAMFMGAAGLTYYWMRNRAGARELDVDEPLAEEDRPNGITGRRDDILPDEGLQSAFTQVKRGGALRKSGAAALALARTQDRGGQAQQLASKVQAVTDSPSAVRAVAHRAFSGQYPGVVREQVKNVLVNVGVQEGE